VVIRQTYFNHKGGLYVYRLHNIKLSKLCNGNGFASLYNYLLYVQKNCPDDYFNCGPRSSCLKFKIVDDIIEVVGHEVSSLARFGLEANKERFNDNHSRVQVFMLENDNSTVAMEVPIWLSPNEMIGYKTIFKSEEILTGHIDILRIDDEKIYIWDYKPNAHREKYAATQLFFYALMLSKRTKIPLNKFRCGYFDQNYAFLFKPEEELLLKLNKQKRLISSF